MTSQSISQCCKNSFKTQNVIRHLKILKRKIPRTSHLIPIKISEKIYLLTIKVLIQVGLRVNLRVTESVCLNRGKRLPSLLVNATQPAARACAVLDTANADAIKQDKRIRATESHFKTSRNSLGEFFRNLYN